VEPELRDKVLEILDRYHRYFESAIRDGQADGSIHVEDPKAATRSLFNLMEGTLTRARIHNDPEVVKDLKGAVIQLVGTPQTSEKAAA
jgi:TetR/AcrR family transcriptional regulator, transcriptional repressor for nem operon